MRVNVAICFILLGVISGISAMARVPYHGERVFDKEHVQKYIISLKESVSRDSHLKDLFNLKFDKDHHFKLDHLFDIHDFSGYVARLNNKTVEHILDKFHEVAFVEPDVKVRISQQNVCRTQSRADWGLNRLNHASLPLGSTYQWSVNASNVNAYIIDTGINIRHVEFQGRAVWGANFADTRNDDCNGHGTHVAGTVGGATYGVAKGVKLIAVKVLGCDGSGDGNGILRGIEFVVNSKKRNPSVPVVINMSLGGGFSRAENVAVDAATRAGIVVVVAAGNENSDACNTSPASASTVLSTGASDWNDRRADFSNWGNCVHIFAPGASIKSAWIGSTTATNTIDGTSMASPHVAGAAALYLSKNPAATPAVAIAALKKAAYPNKITLACARGQTTCPNSANLLLSSFCDTQQAVRQH